MSERAPAPQDARAAPVPRPSPDAGPRPVEDRHGPLWALAADAAPAPMDAARMAALRRLGAAGGNQALAEALAPAPVQEEAQPATAGLPETATDADALAEGTAAPATDGTSAEPVAARAGAQPTAASAARPTEAPAMIEARPDGRILGPAEIRANAAALANRLPDPALPGAAAARAPIDAARAAITERGEHATRAARRSPARLAGHAPAPRQGPAPEDRGPNPEAMAALQAKADRQLSPAQLPAVTASPEGTLPDIRGPTLTEEEIRLVRLGDAAIDMRGLEPAEAARLREVRQQLVAGETASAPAPEAEGAAPAPAVPGSVPVVDTPLPSLDVSPQQRALLAEVVGQLAGDTDGEARRVLQAVRENHATFGARLQQAWLASNGALDDADLLPGVSGAIGEEARLLAESIGLAQDGISAAIAARRSSLEAQRDDVAAAVAAAGGEAETAATTAARRTRAQAAASAQATREAAALDRATAARRRTPPTVRERVEGSVRDIRTRVGEASARYDGLLRNRRTALAGAARQQTSAYRLAQTRDEIALRGNGVASLVNAARVRGWADLRVQEVEAARARLEQAATTEVGTFKTELQAEGGVAFGALRDWASRQRTANEEWWTALDRDLAAWSGDAAARARAFEGTSAATARVGLVQDLAAVQRIAELQEAGNEAAVRAHVAGLDRQSQAVVAGIMGPGGAADLAGGLAAGVRERVRAAQQAVLEPSFHDKVMALPDEAAMLPVLTILLQAVQPGWSVTAAAKRIFDAVNGGGTDEAEVFAALQGLTPLAVKALRIQYADSHGESLQDALEGDLNDDEMRTANDLLEGDAVEGIVGSLGSAVSGWGTDTEAMKGLLRTLPPDQRAEVLRRYEKRYGQSLAAAVQGEAISYSDRQVIFALADGDIRGADALELRGAVEMQVTITTNPNDTSGGDVYWTLDRGRASGVFARIRQEAEAEGTRRGWDTGQIEAEIALRNSEIERAFDERYADAPWAQEARSAEARGESPLRAAFAQAGGPTTDLMNALADNDMAAADVARLRLEDQGIYAEDAAINAVFRDQNARSLAELQRDLGPILAARTEERLAARDRRNPFRTEEDRVNARMQLERESAAELAGLADERTRARMRGLGTNYEAATGRTLSDMIAANMNGTARAEAEARVANEGILTPYQRLRFAMEGVGTDLPELRATLAGMSKEELAEADRQWRDEHGGESLVDAIRGDTSGREEGDLVDMAENGAPQTAQQLVDQARRRYERDRGEDSTIGAAATRAEIDATRRELEGLERNLAMLRDPSLPADRRRAASATFDIRVERTMAAIELQRSAVDALADTMSTAAAIVAAVVVGALLSPFTGGGSAVVAAALISSVVATVASMATKALIKGGAYGAEEFGTDLAIGAVDAIVSVATAGLGRALLGGLRGAVTPVGRSAMFQGLSRLGRAGAMAARGQARVAGFLGRLGTAGPIARAVEGRALLAGLAAETRPMYQRLAARGAAFLVEQTVQALPSSFTGAMLDERVWRQPGGGPLLVLRNTVMGTLQNVASGVGFAAGHNLAGRGLNMVFGAFRRPGLPEVRARPTEDVLGRMGRPEERLAEFRAWRERNPGGSYRDFYAAREQALITGAAADAATRARARAARAELLRDLPPGDRGGYADVPILPLPDAEFHRFTGGAAGDAHIVIRDGQAIVAIREGAPPSAARALLPQLRERVLAGSGGMTLEAALPPRLREAVPIRREASLRGDTVMVVPVPREGGIVRGIEVLVGPHARPIDVALHAGTISRVRRWMGRVGQAQLALAGVAQRLGIDVVTPRERARFEAAEEVRKLGPIIEERLRRYVAAAATNPRAAAEIELDIRHLMAQQERARRVLAGDIAAQPRGYIAAEARPSRPRGKAAPAPAATGPSPSLLAAADTNRRAQALRVEMARLKEAGAHETKREIAAQKRVDQAVARMLARLRTVAPVEIGRLGDVETVQEHFRGADGGTVPVEIQLAMARLGGEHQTRMQGYLDEIRAARADMADADARGHAIDEELAQTTETYSALPDSSRALAELNQKLTYANVNGGPANICFPPGTPVATPGGTVPIGTLRPGDAVWAADAEGRRVPARVTARHDGWTDWLIELRTARGEMVRATRGHRFRADGDWRAARLLRPGMRLSAPGAAEDAVDSVRLVPHLSSTCNLEVAPHACFLVGATGLLVHNGDVEEGARSYGSTREYPGEIYKIYLFDDGAWRLVYVGSTNKQGLSLARFRDHLSQGREGARDFRADKAEWARRYDAAGGAVTRGSVAGVPFHEFGGIRIEIPVHGNFTDLALAIVEQAHIAEARASGAKLANRSDAMWPGAFETYWEALTPEQRARHNPCR